ncbi:MAG: metallophosphoesterase family protein [Candidatus Omnitrophica bacterium]|nr:metallophosphoesterase family protein [Candidatus Omnitrophota bacterium]
MKIGVVSDTHSLDIPAEMLEDFKKMDLIIHAGDFCTSLDLETFRRIKEVRAVCGNMDEAQLRRVLPRREIFTLAGVAVGIFHGEGPRERTLETVRKEFHGQKPDVVVFGHSHQPFNQEIDGVLYFNPGSPSDGFTAPYRSYGVLEIESGKIKGKIVKLKG